MNPMKTITLRIFSCIAFSVAGLSAQSTYTFTNFIRQVQKPSNVEWDISVDPTGERPSGLSVQDGGAQFELWTVKSNPLTTYLLDTKFVGSYIPSATIRIESEDPYGPIPRTRVDRPFKVYISVSGLAENPAAPAAARSVTLLRHVQSYGPGGTAANINRNQATLHTQTSITGNITEDPLRPYQVVPSEVSVSVRDGLQEVRGEERFSIFSIADILSPSAQLASQYVQVWPMASGAITGVVNNQVYRSKLPPVTLDMKNLYPGSMTYLQVYKGPQVLGTLGTMIPGWQCPGDANKPKDDVRPLQDWDVTMKDDGKWTLELITSTPFGLTRLAWVTFELNRNLQVNGMLGTME